MKPIEPIQLPTYIEENEKVATNTFGEFTIGPFEPGFGTTVANSLRRVLLSSIQGGAVRFIKIEGLNHQYQAIPGVKEDYIELILNLKDLVLKIDSTKEEKIELKAKGPGVVKAGDISTPKIIEVVNKDLYLMEITEEKELFVELWVGNGIGYVREEEHDAEDRAAGVIPVDSIYSPIQKVNYKIGAERVDKKIDYDKVILEINTDGSVSPETALNLAAKLLKDSYKAIMEFEKEPEYVEREEIDPELKSLKKLMKMSVDELELSVRCSNCMAAAKIDTVKELIALTEDNLLHLRNFGKKSLDEVKKVLERYGLKLGTDVSEIDEKLAKLKEIEERNEA
ncbi:MAG: DNA-directed RNA polymerase subunit alpha [Candidatus Cloacimonetes bacterium]|nr:DNA-directed RNA polymerase subunit alpha [Candidatus Cloacimonadota bacterium]MBS3766941.1 DNA-directed RNA polymerase subunit alpha [Candidatus Cloacimonadota bacterium]